MSTPTHLDPRPPGAVPTAENPLDVLAAWLDEAHRQGVREPGAMALATVDRHARSSSRTVAVLDAGPGGILFTSHAGSRKAADIAETGRASGLLYWRETGRQVAVAGPVGRIPDTESTALWLDRPPHTHVMSAVSQQSAPLHDEAALRRAAERLAARGEPIPRPDGWCGYRLRPETVEFWTTHPQRLYRRQEYRRDGAGWTVRRLQP